MLNVKRIDRSTWIVALLAILVFVLVFEQRNTRKVHRQILNSLSMFPDKIFEMGDARIYVPNYPIDLIQSRIVDKGTFFEIDELEGLRPYIKKNAVILDIGANIGNHTVYWAVKANARKIYSFEPIKETFKILKKNVEINDLVDRVKIFNIGLSNEKINGSIIEYSVENTGGTSVKQDANGNLLIDKLDNIKIEEDSVDFVKIDVEGHEFQTLQGARETLLKYKPTIFIEILSDECKRTDNYLTSLGYRLEKKLRHRNYLYVFDEKSN